MIDSTSKLVIHLTSIVDLYYTNCRKASLHPSLSVSSCLEKASQSDTLNLSDQVYGVPLLCPALHCFSTYPNLRRLSLAHCGLSKLSSYLRNEVLIISSRYSCLDDSITELLQQVISHNVSLASLDLSYNTFTHEGIKRIAQTIHSHRSLQSWNISYNWIETPAWHDLFMTTSRLHELFIERCLAPTPSSSSSSTLHLPFTYGRKIYFLNMMKLT